MKAVYFGNFMKITKDQLQKLIREEYVKVLFETDGYKLSDAQVSLLAESLEEGFFDSIKKAVRSGAETFKKSQELDSAAASKKKRIEQKAKNEKAVVVTEEQLKEKIVAIRQSTKDMLMKNGYIGDPNDISVLGVDLFKAAVEEVMAAGPTGPIRKFKGEVPYGAGKYTRRAS